MSPSITAFFENDKKIFFAGQEVRGRVAITTNKIISIKEIKLKVEGSSYVKWTIREKDKTRRISTRENYYTIRLCIWGNGRSCQSFPIGTHYTPFAFVLPSGIPSSFEGKFGYVRHVLRVIIDIESDFFDTKQEIPFSVGSVCDLNLNPMAKDPIQRTKQKNVCCWCCKGGTLSFMLNIDHSGYVPGENIVVNAECSNRSDRQSDRTLLQVTQTVDYRAQGRSKSESSVVLTRKHAGVDPGEDDIWSGELVRIPPLPPTGLPGCDIIDIKYTLSFSFTPGGCTLDLSTSTEIFIGSIPLRSVFHRFANRPLPQPPSSQPPQPQPAFSQPPLPQPPFSQPYFAQPPFSQPGFSPPSLAPLLAPQPPSTTTWPTAPSAPPPAFGPPAAMFNVSPSAPPVPPHMGADPPPPYPWTELYPDSPPPAYQECAAVGFSTLRFRGEDERSSSDEEEGSSPSGGAFAPHYVSYGWA